VNRDKGDMAHHCATLADTNQICAMEFVGYASCAFTATAQTLRRLCCSASSDSIIKDQVDATETLSSQEPYTKRQRNKQGGSSAYGCAPWQEPGSPASGG